MPPGDGERSCSTLRATRTMSILCIQPTADGGGSETALIAMIRQLSAAGWTCHVAVPRRPRLAEEYASAGARLHVVGMPRVTASEGRGYWFGYAAAWPVSVLRLAWLARRLKVDVVHSNSLHSWYGWAAAWLVRRPHVWHAREIVTQSGVALRVERVLARRFARRVVAISAAVAAQLDPANVEGVTDEPDPDVWSPARAGRWRASVGIADDVPLIGSVGRIDTWKGFGVLLDAVPVIRESVPEVAVVVAGDPVGGKDDYAAGLAARAASLGVRWLGHRRDVPDLLADLDVFVQVSTSPEPWGLVHAEALASGVPIVAGDEGGPVEMLAGAPAGAGRLVRPGDAAALAEAVVGLLTAPGVPRGAEARRRRRRLRAADSGGRRWSELFESVLESGAAQPEASRT